MKIDQDSFNKLWDENKIPKFIKSDMNGNLAGNIAVQAMTIFKYLLENRKENERVDLVCCTNGREFAVKNMGFIGDTIFVESHEEGETTFCLYALVSQVAFIYVVSPITDDKPEPQREVGFHTFMGTKV